MKEIKVMVSFYNNLAFNKQQSAEFIPKTTQNISQSHYFEENKAQKRNENN